MSDTDEVHGDRVQPIPPTATHSRVVETEATVRMSMRPPLRLSLQLAHLSNCGSSSMQNELPFPKEQWTRELVPTPDTSVATTLVLLHRVGSRDQLIISLHNQVYMAFIG